MPNCFTSSLRSRLVFFLQRISENFDNDGGLVPSRILVVSPPNLVLAREETIQVDLSSRSVLLLSVEHLPLHHPLIESSWRVLMIYQVWRL